jgi:hypothetical protein
MGIFLLFSCLNLISNSGFCLYAYGKPFLHQTFLTGLVFFFLLQLAHWRRVKNGYSFA